MTKEIFIAGPCVIESKELLDTVAQELVKINKELSVSRYTDIPKPRHGVYQIPA